MAEGSQQVGRDVMPALTLQQRTPVVTNSPTQFMTITDRIAANAAEAVALQDELDEQFVRDVEHSIRRGQQRLVEEGLALAGPSASTPTPLPGLERRVRKRVVRFDPAPVKDVKGKGKGRAA
jgi:hypothetical protein